MYQSQVENQENLLSDSINALQAYFALIESILKGTDKPTVLDELCQVTEDYCHIDFENKKQQNAVDEVREHLAQLGNEDDDDMDVEELYNQKYNADTSTIGNIKDTEIWCQVFGEGRNDVQEVSQVAEEPVEYYEEMQDSIMCSTNTNFKPIVDPITKQAVRDPCKSRKCRHVYERESIMQYIKSRKKKGAKCPYIGCTYDLALQDLADDRELKEKTQNYFSSQASNSESDELESD